MEIIEILKKLCDAEGVSGDEYAACRVARALLAQYTDTAGIDSFGSVTAFIGDRNEKKPTVMLEAHIDEIGFIVSFVDENGFVKVGSCGGTDRRLYAAQTVTIHGREKITGVISTLPPHVSSDNKKTMKTEEIAIDTGYDKKTLSEKISLGDRVTINSPFTPLLGTRASGKAIDNRAGVAAVIYAVSLLEGKKLPFNVEILFASQEEVGSRGAKIGAYNSSADFAIATDVSYAYTPDAKKEQCGEMGKGAMVGIAPSLDRAFTKELMKIAADKKIPYQTEVMGGRTGTDADDISGTKGGIKTALLSVPIKYMHTPVETVDTEDIKSVAEIMAEFIMGGTENV